MNQSTDHVFVIENISVHEQDRFIATQFVAQGPQGDDVALFIILVEYGSYEILGSKGHDLPINILTMITNTKHELVYAVTS